MEEGADSAGGKEVMGIVKTVYISKNKMKGSCCRYNYWAWDLHGQMTYAPWPTMVFCNGLCLLQRETFLMRGKSCPYPQV